MARDGEVARHRRAIAFDHLGAAAAVLGPTGEILDTNRAWRLFMQLNGGSEADCGVGVNYLDVCRRAGVDDPVAADVEVGLRGVLDGEHPQYRVEYPCPSPGQERWFLLEVAPAPVAEGRGAVVTHVDISARKRLELILRTQAEIDPLTGLHNRRAGLRRLDRMLRASASVNVLLVDVDDFKSVNDAHGHQVGDELLRQVGERLRRAVRAGDVVCRIGGDEFLAVVRGIPADARPTAERVERALAEPYQVGGTLLRTTATVGVASGVDAPTADGVLAAADAHMYRRKPQR